MPPKKRKGNPDGGTGYGGNPNDTKRLVTGLKKAEKNSLKEDTKNIAFLKKSMLDIQEKLLCSEGWEGIDTLVSEDEKKLIISTLAHIFRNQVPTDWDKRKDLYDAALNLSRILATDARLGTLFGSKDDQEGILFWLVDFGQQADEILKRDANDAELWTDPNRQGELLLATQVSEVADLALKISRRCLSGKPEEEISTVSQGERYQQVLGSLRFETVAEMSNHFFLKTTPQAPSTLNTRQLFKELTAYRNALPVEYGSSIFCRVIDSRLDLLRVMITGPDETPYANGCFFFDIQLPATYPQVAPKVNYLTTGGGKMRFNPNLYHNGKVCLSLLGTWAGPGWISGKSTLFQVLISIQSLILVPDPYFNEPGWEHERGTKEGSVKSEKYNKKIRGYTVVAAIGDHLFAILKKRNVYPEFESVMIHHFLQKRGAIEKDLRSWAKKDPAISAKVDKVCGMLSRLESREKESRKANARISRESNTNVAVGIKPCKANNDDPIILDDSDEECKANNDDPIILDDSDEECKEILIAESFDDKKSSAVPKKADLKECDQINASGDANSFDRSRSSNPHDVNSADIAQQKKKCTIQ